jgi:hypothetical protein
MSMAIELTDFINDTDPFTEGSLLFKTGMYDVLRSNKEIQKDLRRNMSTNYLSLFKKKTK